jgi:hypothetical protein
MDDRPEMRASDADRQQVVERLRAALDDGRLKMDEYLDRMGRAYEAVTYGDLAQLCSDLPQTAPLAKPEPAPPAPVPQAAPVRAENLVRSCDQQSCPPSRPAVMITGHVPAVRLPPDHAVGLMAAAVPA